MRQRHLHLTLLTSLLLGLAAHAATLEDDPTLAKRSAWWRDAKFGMFIHWGVYAVPAAGEWIMHNQKIQVKDYEQYPPRFNPTQFSAREWVSLAKAAGMKYIVITSKHHDGFSMFDSKLTTYDIVDATPFKRDPLRELARECRRQGIRLGFYYSVMDWHHPDYLPRRPWEAETRPATGADFSRYLAFMKGQLRELLTGYGDIAVLWFDGAWEGNAEKHQSEEIVRMVRRLRPGILINDRINLPEDFSTPEQTIPAGAMPRGRLWETCMTLNGNWGYARGDDSWKSPADLVRKLCDIAHKGGNFLLNVGPTETGVIPQPSVDRLREVGRWMRVNGESIYGTSRSPFRRLSFDGRCTVKGSRLYLQVFQWPEEGIRLQGLKTGVRSARVLGGGKTEVRQVSPASAEEIPYLHLSRPTRLDPLATVVELRLEGPPVVEEPVFAVSPDSSGVIRLKALDADIHGTRAQYENDKDAIGYWTDRADHVSWNVRVPSGGEYEVTLTYACDPSSPGGRAGVVVGDEKSDPALETEVKSTGSWTDFTTVSLGRLRLERGTSTVRVKALSLGPVALMNLRELTLTSVR